MPAHCVPPDAKCHPFAGETYDIDPFRFSTNPEQLNAAPLPRPRVYKGNSTRECSFIRFGRRREGVPTPWMAEASEPVAGG